MTTYFITRHSGAIEWARHCGIAIDRQLAHLDTAIIQPQDIVIGILPVNLAAEVCARGGRFFNLNLELPLEARGKELSASELTRYNARLEEYKVQPIPRPPKEAP